MNLKEALSILRHNNYLVEFLHDTKMFNTDIVIKRINKETNANLKKVKADGRSTVYVSTKITIKNKDIINKIREIAKIYNMSALIRSNYTYVKNLPLPNIAIELESDSINEPYRIYNPVNNSRLFIHWSKIPPEVIQRTGLRPKNIFVDNDEYFMKDENYERRIYLSSLEKWDNIKDDTSLDKIINIIQKRINNDCENGRFSLKDDPNYQWKYMYLIKLPDNFPIRNDPEGVVELGETECDWVYTVHNIPSKYILYLASIIDEHPNTPRKEIAKFISR